MIDQNTKTSSSTMARSHHGKRARIEGRRGRKVMSAESREVRCLSSPPPSLPHQGGGVASCLWRDLSHPPHCTSPLMGEGGRGWPEVDVYSAAYSKNQ